MAIKINFDAADMPQPPTLILANKNGTKLGLLNAKSVVVKECLNSASEISFLIYRYENGLEHPLWNEILNYKLLWCKEWDAWFEITVETEESGHTVKSVYASQLGCAELSQIMLYQTEINTEDDISREDYAPTVFYDKDRPDASLLHRLLIKAPHYSVLYVDSSIADIQRTFSFHNTSIYDAFGKVAEEIGCLFVYGGHTDSDGVLRRTVSVYDLKSVCADCGCRGDFSTCCPDCGSADISEGFGNDTTIFITPGELAEDVRLTEDTGAVKNCFRLEGGDDMMTAAIRNCNPNGSDTIWYFTETAKKEMSQALKDRLTSYDALYQYYQNDYQINLSYKLKNTYNSLIRKYQAYNEALSPLPDTVTGYPAFMTAYYNVIDFAVYLKSALLPDVEISKTTAQEQAQLLTSETLSPVAVPNAKILSHTTSDHAVLSAAKAITDARYQVKIESSSLTGDVWTGTFLITNYSDQEDTAKCGPVSVSINDDYETFVLQKLKKSLHEGDTKDVSVTSLFANNPDDFREELKKYCLDSLNSFYDICNSCIDILVEQGIADPAEWSDKNRNLYEMLYLPFLQKQTAIHKEQNLRRDELIIVAGETVPEGDFVWETPGVETDFRDEKRKIQKELDFEAYLGEELLTEFSAFRREDTYSNSNYISDGLNNAELFDRALEFLKTAREEIYKSAELQHSVSASLKNLLAVKKFRPLADSFAVGNWIRVRLDDSVYKLRLIEYEIDYDNPDRISVEFSDVLQVKNGVSDTESILSQAGAMASSYDYVQHQAGQANKSASLLKDWTENGLSVTNTKIIGGGENQTQTWDERGILLRKYNPFTDEYDGEQMKFINSTLAITNDNWKTVKTAVGGYYYFHPETGKLTYAYGINGETVIGKLMLGEHLGIYNDAGSLTFNENGLLIKNDAHSFCVNPNSDTLLAIAKNDKKIFYLDDNGNLTLTGNIEGSGGEFTSAFSVKVPIGNNKNAFWNMSNDDNGVTIALEQTTDDGQLPYSSLTFQEGAVSLAGYHSVNIHSKDDVHIASETAPVSLSDACVNGNLQVTGTLFTESGTVSSSDREGKNSIETLPDEACAAFICSLNPCRFKYNDGTSGRYHHGLLAQDVKQSMGEHDWGLYIDKNPKEPGNKALRYEELISDLIGAVKYQQKQIEELKKERCACTKNEHRFYANKGSG